MLSMDSNPPPEIHPTESEPDIRWIRIWNLISYLLLLLTTAVALSRTQASTTTRLICAGFAIIYAVWYWIFIVELHRWGRKSLVLALSFSVIVLLLAGMITVDGIYFMLLFSLYGVIFSVLETRLAIPVTIFLSVAGIVRIITYYRMRISDAGGVILGFGLSTFFAVTFSLYITAIIKQNRERKQMIDELKSTREELARAERQAGIFEERQRLAREIHDTLAQGFTSIVMQLEAADQSLPSAPALINVRQHIEKARDIARESLSEARRFVWALRSESHETESVVKAIERVAKRWTEENGITTQVEISGEEIPLPPAYGVTLLRSSQEALENVRKHAQARQVNLTLSFMNDQVILDVQDDGQGFDPQHPRIEGQNHGYGLVGMRERVEQLGGSLVIESAPGEGTTLVIDLPMSHTIHPVRESLP